MSTYMDSVYLKHSGRQLDVKVSIKKVEGKLRIHIRDMELSDHKKALAYLRYIAETEFSFVADETSIEKL